MTETRDTTAVLVTAVVETGLATGETHPDRGKPNERDTRGKKEF